MAEALLPEERRAIVRRYAVVGAALAALLGLVAVPRTQPLSAGSVSARAASLEVELQGAVDDYRRDHGRWPGFVPPLPSAADRAEAIASAGLDERASVQWLGAQLLGRTDRAGRPDRDGAFGPYLGKVPVNPLNGCSSFAVVQNSATPTDDVGWLYDARCGSIHLAGTER